MTNDFLEEMFSQLPTTPVNIDAPDPNDDDPIDPQDPSDDDNDDPIDPPPPTTVVEDERISGYIKFLQENELVDIPEDLSELQGTPEELESIFEHTKKVRFEKAVDTIFDSLPQDFQPLFEYALAGGTSLNEFMKTYGEDPIDNIDLESEYNQRKVLREYYQRTTKHTPEKIDRLISLFSDPDDLRVAAEEAVEDLQTLKAEQKKQLIDQAAREAQAQRDRIQQQTIALATSIDSSNLIHPQRKNKVKSFFFEPIQVGNQTTTSFNHTIQTILQNPEHQAQLGDLLLEYDPANGFVMDRLEKKVKTKATQSFNRLLEKTLDPKQKLNKAGAQGPSNSQLSWEKYQQHL